MLTCVLMYANIFLMALIKNRVKFIQKAKRERERAIIY